MKFGVLALDYDGTAASDGLLHAEVRAAIEEVHARGMARPGRVELPTLCLEGRRSIQLSYGRTD